MVGIARTICLLLTIQSGIAGALSLADLENLSPKQRDAILRRLASEKTDENVDALSGRVNGLEGEVAFKEKSEQLLKALQKKVADKMVEWSDYPIRTSLVSVEQAENEENRVAGKKPTNPTEFASQVVTWESVADRGIQANTTFETAVTKNEAFKMEFPRVSQKQTPIKDDPSKSILEGPISKPAEIRKNIEGTLLVDITKTSAEKLSGYIIPDAKPAAKPVTPEPPPATETAPEAALAELPHQGTKTERKIASDSPPEEETFVLAAQKVKEFTKTLKEEALAEMEKLEKEREAAGDQPNEQASNGAGDGLGGGGEEAKPSESPKPEGSGGGGSGGGGSGAGGGGDGKGGGGSAGGAKVPVDSIVGSGVNGGPIPENGSFSGGGLGSFLSSGIKAVIDKAQEFTGKFIPQQGTPSSHPIKKTSAEPQLASAGISKGGAGGGGGGGGPTVDPTVNGGGGEGRGISGGSGGGGSPLGGDIGAGIGADYGGEATKNATIDVAYGANGSVDGGGEIGIKAPKDGDLATVGALMRQAPTQREISSSKKEPGAIFNLMNSTVKTLRKENRLAPTGFGPTV